MKYTFLMLVLLLPACTCGVKIDSKPSESELAATQAADDDRRVQSVVAKYTHQEISDMWVDAYRGVHDGKDKRPESTKNERLLYKALELSKPKYDLSKVDAVNEKLKGL